MATPTVIGARIEHEPVTVDPFVAGLDRHDCDGRVAALLALAAASPRRRIYD